MADATIAYIRDGNMGKAITAMTGYRLAPVNDDTVAQVTELLIPTKPKPVWTDTRGRVRTKTSTAGGRQSVGANPNDAEKVRGRRVWMDL